MAQSYFSSRISSPVKEEFVFSGSHADRQLKVEDIEEAYIESKKRFVALSTLFSRLHSGGFFSLLSAIDSTQVMLSDIRAFNRDEWVVRYPQFRDKDGEPSSEMGLSSSKNRACLSLSFADDPTHEKDVVIDSNSACSLNSTSLDGHDENSDSDGLKDTCKNDDEHVLPSSDFNVLRLDLKLGPHAPTSAASLVSQLEKSSIAKLLDERFVAAINHIGKLKLRVEDTSSKVLVTGDLNAGKSTFVNALLRREVMPVDQQPCTTAFCEVHDAAENGGKEEVHIVRDGRVYDIRDALTYTTAELSCLEEIVTDNEHTQRVIKIYLADTRAPSESLLNNGVVDISLIDAPGLNRDSIKTTAVFSRQEEIDVVVFVLAAYDHFTLSSKEFMQTASNEKAYIFVVVNKYDQIKDKDKCRRAILGQLREFSPQTYEDAQDLVHFVDSASALQPYVANPAFDDLEQSLRSFVLVKRSKSKLQPVSTYLCKLLSDVHLLARTNALLAESERLHARDELDEARPVLEKLQQCREAFEDVLEAVEESGAEEASARTKTIFSEALERIGQGLTANNESSLPVYPGLLGVWDYAQDIRRAQLASLDAAVSMAEDEARLMTTSGVNKIKDLAEKYLPQGVERSRRVFMPEAMFRTRRGGRGIRRRQDSGAVVAGGAYGLGIGLSQQHDLLETTFADILDINHHFLVHFGDGKEGEEEPSTSTALGYLSIGIGALTMVGGQAIGLRGLVEGVARVTDILGIDGNRRWVAPLLGAFTIGMTAYLVLDLPASIPRTVGRRVKASILSREVNVVDAHAARIARETRKVLRLASWDLKERYRGALDSRTMEVTGAEQREKKALKAKEWLSDVGERTVKIRAVAKLESIA